MKLVYGSDLHLEFQPFDGEFPEGDVLILAGDIVLASKFKDHYREFFHSACSHYEHVIMVMGNHEHYRGELNTSAARIRSELVGYDNFILLDNETFCHDGIVFYGGTMWTDFDGSPFLKEYARGSMNDYKVIRMVPEYRRLHPNDVVHEFVKFRRELDKALMEYKTTPMVVISHHGPTSLSNDLRYRGDPLNAAYVADMSDYMLDNEDIKLWFHGHIHDQKDYEIGNARVLCNPRGYPFEDSEQFEFKTVEI